MCNAMKVVRLAIVWLLLLEAGGAAGEKTFITIDDLYRFDAPSGLVVAPDCKSAVYVRRWNDRASRNPRQSLWRVLGSSDRRHALEEGEPDARQPLYSPDGRWIVFLSDRPLPNGTPAFTAVPPYSDPAGDIWVMPASGGRAVPLAGPGKPYGRVFGDPFYGHVSFLPDGKRLAFVADDGHDPRTPDEIAHHVRIVREDQGEGYEGYRPAQIWVADLADTPGEAAAARVRRLTHDDFWYGDPQWSPDGRFIVAHANRTPDQESVRYSINKNYDLWRIDVATGRIEPLTTGPGPEVSPRFSPDGRRLLCMSLPRRGSHFDVFNLMVIELGDSGPQGRVLFDHHGPQASEPPHLPPSFPLPRDCWLSGDRFSYTAAARTASRAQVIDLTRGAAAVDGPPESHSAEHARRSEARRRLTPPGDVFLRDRIVSQGTVVRWSSFDGREIEGILTAPAGPAARKPYKMVLYPHGGPHSRSAAGFDFTVQVLAAQGYAVFQPNFRGSAGYGQRFLEADRFDFGGGDMRDILAGVDYLVKQGTVDPHRQFVYGISYGGYMTSWLIGHTRQFRAAVPQNAVTDLNAMWGLSDLQSWTEWEFGGRPWEVPQAMRAHSPLTYAPNVRTPTLILHASNDRRCPLPMGLMLYRALQKQGVDVQMVVYPDEGHPIKQLPHQEDVLRRVLDWFAKHDS